MNYVGINIDPEAVNGLTGSINCSASLSAGASVKATASSFFCHILVARHDIMVTKQEKPFRFLRILSDETLPRP